MADGLVSVVVPTYNRAAVLAATLGSVHEQDYRPVELIVVDDGSHDDTEAEVAAWARTHADDSFHVRYERQPNGGAPRARNRGVALAKGDYLQFLDSDDRLLAGKLSAQVEVLRRHRSVGYVWSDHLRSEHPDQADPGPFDRPAVVYRGADKWRSPLKISAGLYRRALVDEIGPWDETLRRFQDWNYNVRALLTDWDVAHLPGLAYVTVVHGGERISYVGHDALDAGRAQIRLKRMRDAVHAVHHARRRLGRALATDRPPAQAARHVCARMLLGAATLAAEAGRLATARRLAAESHRFSATSSHSAKCLVLAGFVTARQVTGRMVRSRPTPTSTAR